MTSPWGRTTSVRQSGQRFGIRHGFVPGSCSPAGPTTCGMTSPARWTITRSPTRMSFRRMSSSLCSVALVTVTPPTCTGSSSASGFRTPVRPTRTWIAVRRVTAERRRPLERTREARAAVQGAETTLLVERVELDHDAVDLVSESRSPLLPGDAGVGDVVDRVEALRVRVRAETALLAATRAPPTARRARDPRATPIP